MKTISKRELNHQTAQVLAAIQAGEAVLVTERGVPRWRIEAVDASADPVERLRAQGRIRPASPNPPPQIGRAHVCTPVTNAHLVCRLLLEQKKHYCTGYHDHTQECQ